MYLKESICRLNKWTERGANVDKCSVDETKKSTSGHTRVTSVNIKPKLIGATQGI